MSAAQDISIRILDGGRSAQLHIPAGTDAGNLTPSLLHTIAAEAKLRITPEVEARFKEIIADYLAQPREIIAPCASAIEPVNGTDGSWTWEPAFDPSAISVSTSADGQSTNHHASHIHNVVTGVFIAKLIPPGDGVDGSTVTGAVIPAKPGHPSFLSPGDGLSLHSDGRVLVVKDGVIGISAGIVTVSSLLEIKDCVDFSTGQIDFHGDVVVGNSVRDGFLVRALGNITVNGPVEGATLFCTGNLSCPRGIASARRAKLLIEGAATVGYLRNVGGIFKGDLSCHGEVEHSDIAVGGDFHCDRGRVIGGTLVLSANAAIGTIGSAAWAPTLVCVGVLPFVAIEWKRLTAESLRVHRAITVKEKALFELQSGKADTARAREQLTEIQYEVSELNREASEIDGKLEHYKTEMQKARRAELKVTRIIYPKVRVKYGNSIFEFDKELKGPLQFLLDERGMIHIRIASQDPRPITDFAHTVSLAQAADQSASSHRAAA